jgi:hypothetical protein
MPTAARLSILVLPALLVAIGCTAFTPRTAADYEPGQTPHPQFTRDNEACARQSEADQNRFGMGGDLDPTHSTFNRMYDACMRASGYKRKQDAK